MPKGGIKDLNGTFETLALCINCMMDRSSRGLLDWWQIYDSETCLMLDSKEPYQEREMKQLQYMEKQIG